MQSVLSPGTELRGRYRIEQLVGQGGMGAVYRAADLRLPGRTCAVKEIHRPLGPALTEEQLRQEREQFKREARLLANLDHPNLPKVSDMFEAKGRDYLVMDFVAGLNLRDRLLRRPQEQRIRGLPEHQVLEWCGQLLDALDYLHSRTPPVLHRDIKPANIIVTPEGLAKLVDFGLVQQADHEDQQTLTVAQGRGTLAYTPLEQLGGDVGLADAKADIYSLGATLYHLLSGRVPPTAQVRFLTPGSLPELRGPGRRVSRRTENAVFKAMALHPDERIASAAEFRSHLALESSAGPQFSFTNAPPDTWGTALRAHRGALALTLLLLLAGLILSLLPGLQA